MLKRSNGRASGQVWYKDSISLEGPIHLLHIFEMLEIRRDFAPKQHVLRKRVLGHSKHSDIVHARNLALVYAALDTSYHDNVKPYLDCVDASAKRIIDLGSEEAVERAEESLYSGSGMTVAPKMSSTRAGTFLAGSQPLATRSRNARRSVGKRLMSAAVLLVRDALLPKTSIVGGRKRSCLR
jgi:hypothetical protein